MLDFANPYVRLILGFCGVSVVTAVGFYFTSRIRAQSLQHEPTTEAMLQNFREMHIEGVLDDAEFRTIRKQLSERVVRETVRTIGQLVIPLGILNDDGRQRVTTTGQPIFEFDNDGAADDTQIVTESHVETSL